MKRGVSQQQQQQQQQQYSVDDIGGNGPFVPLEDTLQHTTTGTMNYNSSSHNHNYTASSTVSAAPGVTSSSVTSSSSAVMQHPPLHLPSLSQQHQHPTIGATTGGSISPKKTTSTSSSTPATTSTTTTTTTTIINLYHKLRHVILQKSKTLDTKKIISSTVFTLLFLLITDSMWSSPEHRIVPPNFANHFLLWVQDHPASGLIWILLVMSVAVICMIPIGTPLTLGCGYIYKGAYGWQLGVLIATMVSMMGSALGAVICFLLGRYMMRDMVKKWIRKYPIFDAIDIAATEHGLRIMAMLYLTPILPLGPVSYMCGTTSLKLSHFIIAKIAALPLMMLYVLIGASTGTLIGTSTTTSSTSTSGSTTTTTDSIESNETLIISGILLSFASIAGITHYIKKELNHILERQKRELEQIGSHNNGDGVEFSHTAANTILKDVENGSTAANTFIHFIDSGDSSTPISLTSSSSSPTMNTPISSKATPPSSSSNIRMESDDIPVTTTTTTTGTTTAPRQRKH